MFSKLPAFQGVLKDTRHKNLRHLCFHNNAEIDIERRIINEGILFVATHFNDKPVELFLFQLWSFYDLDKKYNKRIKEVNDYAYTVYSKEVIRAQKKSASDQWYILTMCTHGRFNGTIHKNI